MLNKAILIGRLTDNPELKTTPSGVSVCTFSIACDRKFSKDEKSADFLNIVAWRQAAEFVVKYFTKGRAIGIEGSIQTRSYEDKQGNKRYVTEIVADSVFFTGDKKVDTNIDAQGFEDISTDGDLPF